MLRIYEVIEIYQLIRIVIIDILEKNGCQLWWKVSLQSNRYWCTLLKCSIRFWTFFFIVVIIVDLFHSKITLSQLPVRKIITIYRYSSRLNNPMCNVCAVCISTQTVRIIANADADPVLSNRSDILHSFFMLSDTQVFV